MLIIKIILHVQCYNRFSLLHRGVPTVGKANDLYHHGPRGSLVSLISFQPSFLFEVTPLFFSKKAGEIILSREYNEPKHWFILQGDVLEGLHGYFLDLV